MMKQHRNKQAPKVIAWEMTKRCMLACKHCRGAARDTDYKNELTTEECKKTIDNIAELCSPILIMTGGEPMSRSDIYELAKYASDKGLYPVMAPCGFLITPETAQKMVDSGIKAISISIDGATAETHDAFRGVSGAYDKTMQGLQNAIDVGMPFQINVTVTKNNIDDLPAILEKAIKLGAKTLDLFFLVPTGRGSAIRDLEISPQQHEFALQWVYEMSQTAPLRVKTTCAPHYVRVQKENRKGSDIVQAKHPMGHGGDPNYVSGGCMAGDGFVFISHTGVLQTCGFLDIPCGDLREYKYNFERAYHESVVFQQLRDVKNLEGKCGVCEYSALCGGCRARAFGHNGNYLSEEPGCIYVPESN